MSLPITVPYTFGNVTSSIPLSNLDSDFATVYAAVNGIGNGTVSLANLSVTGGTIANATISSYTAPNSTGSTTFGFKNRIINGALTISQYNGSSSVTPSASNTYSIDRWNNQMTVASKFSVQQVTTAPAGFSNSMLFSTASTYSVGSGDYFGIEQRIEGYNFYDLAWGTASAKPATLSFWAYANNSGTYCASLQNNGGSLVSTYTLSANTWTYVTIPIPASTTYGFSSTTNGSAVSVRFTFSAGSNFSTSTLNAWQSGNYGVTSGAFNFINTSGATLNITGVQLEVGSSATSFDYRPYGTELNLCQRYYWQFNNDGGNYGAFAQGYQSGTGGPVIYPIPQVMRIDPSVTQIGNIFNNYPGSGTSVSSFLLYSGFPYYGDVNYGASFTGPSFLRANNDVTARIQFSAEL
jgi:hypothetical protein